MNPFHQPETELAAGIRFFTLLVFLMLTNALVQCSIHDTRDEIKRVCGDPNINNSEGAQ
jgi:hypothetical protein